MRGRAAIAGFAIGCWLVAMPAIAAVDFNADGRSDVMWRQANGQPLLWLMDGLSAPTRLATGPLPGNNWVVAGTGRFGGSNDAGIAWLTPGEAPVFWYTSGGQYTGSCVSSAVPANGSIFLGIGDVDGDGNPDLLWKTPGGSVDVWLMSGCPVARTLALGVASGSASIVADFDADGRSDLLWRGASDQYTLWLLDGNGIRTSSVLTPAIPADWQLAKAADFNADGNADLLWRLPDGSLRVSYIEGTTHTDVVVAPANADEIFASGFDPGPITPPTSLPANWHVVDVGDYDGDGHPDILFASDQGYTEVWQMSGAAVLGAVLWPPSPDMPYAGITGWALPVDRPSVTMSNGQVSVAWAPVAGVASYTLYASAQNNPVATGVAIPINGTALTFGRNDPGYADKRYFGVTTSLLGWATPPSAEAYLVEFNQVDLGYIGPMAIADINRDGCIDIIGALGNCHGDFSLFPEVDMGLGALRANGRVWRDLRFADFDGDGIDDLVANVYAAESDLDSRVLLFHGVGNSQFVEDTDFTAFGLGGFGETIVVADFDNDGDLDIFLPKYTFLDPSEHNYLLMNDGLGHFTDAADAAGVAMRNIPVNYRPEGAEGVDLNDDGRIDLYAGSHLFFNQTTQSGQPVFVDEAADRGVPLQFDEGAKFVDWNNDGNLDLVLLVPWAGPQLYESNGNSFHFVNAMPGNITWNQVNGLNAADVDGDGRTDLVAAGGCAAGYVEECSFVGAPHKTPRLLLNRGSSFVQSDYFDDGFSDDLQRPLGDLQTVADFDANGTLDLAIRYPEVSPTIGMTGNGTTKILMNRANSARSIHVTVLGDAGQHNQFGRVVRVSVLAKPGFVMTDVVDGGSGYMANTPYTLQFAAPYAGAYRIEVGFADRQVDVLAAAGQDVIVYADGRVSGAQGPATVTLRAPSSNLAQR